MMCPKCNSKSRVINSRPSNYGIYRRRQCLECGHRFSTQEVLSLNVEEASRKMGRLKTYFKKFQSSLNELANLLEANDES